jgi:hypothetical protein
MKQLHQKQLQGQVESLILIIELCLPFRSQIETTQGKFNILPDELRQLKQQLQWLQEERSQNYLLESQVQETEFKLDFLTNDLEGILINLTILKDKINNLVVLKERLEALQEERIDSLTSERIYKLLEKQQSSRSQVSENEPETKKQNVERHWWKNLTKKLNKQTLVSLSIISSLTLGWIAGYCSSKIDWLFKHCGV